MNLLLFQVILNIGACLPNDAAKVQILRPEAHATASVDDAFGDVLPTTIQDVAPLQAGIVRDGTAHQSLFTVTVGGIQVEVSNGGSLQSEANLQLDSALSLKVRAAILDELARTTFSRTSGLPT